MLTTAGLLGFANSPSLRRQLGFDLAEFWFADSYAVLAASDAAKAGIDPVRANPLDILHRRHVYSDWWLGLHLVGLSREDNLLVGAFWVGGFLLTAWLLLRPPDVRTTLRYAILVLSPSVLLAIHRANNDLVIFILLTLGVLLLSRFRIWGWIPALLLIALAAGLKFYPIVGAAVFFLLRPARRLFLATGMAVVVLSGVLYTVWSSLGRGNLPIPVSIHTLGAPILLRALGYAGDGTTFIASALLASAAFALMRTKRTAGLTDPARDFESRAAFMLGAAVLVACFLAGVSFGYRWIFGLCLAPWLLAEARDATLPRVRRGSAVLAGVLLPVVLWMDGLYCLAFNALTKPMSPQQMAHWDQTWEAGWRLASQSVAWIFVALLAGWLLEACVATGRELLAARGRENTGASRPD